MGLKGHTLLVITNICNVYFQQQRQAHYFDNIMQVPRPAPEYFKVFYIGRAFPSFLRVSHKSHDSVRIGWVVFT